MQMTAEFRKTERKSGDFDGTAYDFTVMHLLDEQSDVIYKVRLPQGVHSVPFTRGDVITVEVSVADNVKIRTDQNALEAAIAGLLHAAA